MSTSERICLVSGNGLVGFWPMYPDSGLTDENGNGNDGTLGGDVQMVSKLERISSLGELLFTTNLVYKIAQFN